MKYTAQFAPAKLNPVYGRFTKGVHNEASKKFSHLILDHANYCQPMHNKAGISVMNEEEMDWNT